MTTPATSQPRLSVILVVRNGWDDTFRTLLALVEATRGLGVETIVVDDGSSDETARALPLLHGLRGLRADQPAGLVAARNQGAALAGGRLLAFLGNGTEPGTGWILPLLEALEADPRLAAARPSGDPLGSDGLVVRAEAFRELGGFDPAYRERLAELDLCFRLEDRGLRAAEVPGSRLAVASPWGVGLPPSPGDETRLAARWGARLAAPAPPAPRIEAGAGPGRFSVLVPCFNQAHFLGAALDSLLAQTCGDWEALVVDDGSTDATSEVAARYARRDPRIRPFRKENGGVASALNRGLSEARGEWVCWLSSDDLFLPGKLATHRDAARADPTLRFMHTNFELLLEASGRRIPSGFEVATYIPPVELQVLQFLRTNYFNGITIALHREVFEVVEGFDEAFRYGQDYDLWLRTTARFRSRFIDLPTAVTRLHPQQGTALFTEAGILDSARAAAAFLDRHPFQALFPLLDLDRPDHALHAVVAAIRVVILPSSFVTVSGYAPLLLDRIKEWLAQAAPPARELVRRELGRSIEGRDTQAAVIETIRPLLEVPAGGFTFLHRNPLVMLEEFQSRLEARGEAKELAALRRYLAMVADTRSRGLEIRSQAAPLAG